VDQTKENRVSDTRIQIADPTLMRRAASRMVLGLVIVLVLTTFFTAGGISLLIAGELPGLPFAVGGAIVQLALIALVVASLNIRRTVAGDTISSTTLVAARRTATFVRPPRRAGEHHRTAALRTDSDRPR
jgi:hypothetical protein